MSPARVPADPRTSRSPVKLAGLLFATTLLFAGFVALGNWQVHRRTWKLDLIARADSRVHAPPSVAPGPVQWAGLTAANAEYRNLCLDGVFLLDHETLVKAVTDLGPGYWVVTPLRVAANDIVLINRGFVGPEERDPATRRASQRPGPVRVCGLLRLTEPHGAFLRRNDPAHGRWYSRDVAAIATARHLPAQDVAPYFVDADAAPNPGGWPVGGLTVIHFRNAHLVYAITWYTLALMMAGAAAILIRYEWRQRQSNGNE